MIYKNVTSILLSSHAGFNFVINFIKLMVWTPSKLEGDYQMSGWSNRNKAEL